MSADPNSTRTDTKSSGVEPTDPTGYYKWLSTELQRMHDVVKITRTEVKKDDKIKYDRAHKAIEPSWKIGDRVLLQESTVKPGASKVITKQRFVGSNIIQDIWLAVQMSDRPIVLPIKKPVRFYVI